MAGFIECTVTESKGMSTISSPVKIEKLPVFKICGQVYKLVEKKSESDSESGELFGTCGVGYELVGIPDSAAGNSDTQRILTLSIGYSWYAWRDLQTEWTSHVENKQPIVASSMDYL
jgi:hypothetical protein